MADFTQRLKDVSRKVRCHMCEERSEVYHFIQCSECEAHFHKTCVQPLRVEWPADEQFICDECAEVCVVCRVDEDTDENPLLVCDNCDDCFHLLCIQDEEDRPPLDEIGDETAEWYCPECWEEYGSDEEWADGHIVDEADMTGDECFTRSACPCDFCVETNHAVDTWKDWQPENAVRAHMKQAIDAKEGIVNEVMSELHFRHNKPPPPT